MTENHWQELEKLGVNVEYFRSMNPTEKQVADLVEGIKTLLAKYQKPIAPHNGCGGMWVRCPDCVYGIYCTKCGKHDNENDLKPGCKKNRRRG